VIVVADFNNDHKLDLAFADQGPVQVLLGNGDGTFQPSVSYGSDGEAIGLATGDFNRDGQVDLVALNFNGNNATHVSTLLGNGDGTFGSSATYPVGSNPLGLVTADFNGDKKPDIATVNTLDSTVSVLFGVGGGKFGAAANFPVSSGQYGGIVAADFNGDGYPDIATVNYSAGTVSILLNQGDGTFAAYKDYPAGKNACSLVAGDFNNDGKVDLIVGNAAIGFSFLEGRGNGEFKAPVAFGAGISPYSIVAADFNGDGNLDLASVPNDTGNAVSVLLGEGNGTFAPAVNYSTGSGPIAVVAADFNRDGKVDLAVLTGFVPDIAVLIGNGDGTFQTYVTYPSPGDSAKLLSGDFNGKGILDLAVLCSLNNSVNILPGNGKGGFGAATEYYLGIEPIAFIAADFDGNFSTDLAVTNINYNINSITVLLNRPVVASSNGALEFPATSVGAKSPSQSLTFSNSGTAGIAIHAVALAGKDPGDFALTNNCATTLPVGKSCTVNVVFQPSAKGDRSGVLKFTDNAISGIQSVRLGGTGK
jgi:hypothetical protein